MDLKQTFFAVTGIGKSPKLGQELFQAIRDWDSARVAALLAAGADPNVRETFTRQTPLFRAADRGLEEMVEAMLRHGADPNVTDKFGRTALNAACSRGNPAAYKLLMAHGADPLLGDAKCRATTLLCAVSRGYADVLKPLLDSGAATHTQDAGGHTLESLLFLAAEAGKKDCMQLLLGAGAKPQGKDDKGRTLLEQAVTGNDAGCVAFAIEQGGDIRQSFADGSTLLQAAVDAGRARSVQALLDAGADPNERNQHQSTLLHFAAEKGHAEIIELLSKAGADIQLRDQYGRSALNAAVFHKHGDCVAALLKAGLDPNEKWSDRETMLHLAVCFGDIGVAKALIDAGADIHAETGDNDRHSVLRVALQFSNGKADMVKLVLAAGADTQHKSRENQKDDAITDREFARTRCREVQDAVGEAAKKFDLIAAAAAGDAAEAERLLKAGAPPDVIGCERMTPLFLACRNGHAEVVRLLLSYKADLNLVPEGEYSMLFQAVCARSAEAVAALCAAGAPVEALETCHDTALSMACHNGDVLTVKALLCAGADPNRDDGFDKPMIFAAVHSNCAETVEAMAKGGAKVNISLSDGYTPLDLARAKGNEKMIDVLKHYRRLEIEQMATDATCLSGKVSALKTLRFRPS